MESTLTLRRDHLRQAVGNLLGVGTDLTAWESEFSTRVDSCVDIGCRKVYYPEALPGEDSVHVWSFMQPKMFEFQLTRPYGEGSVEIVDGVVTLTDGTWPAWAADAQLTVDGVSYEVNTRDSDTQLTLKNLTVQAVAGSKYTLVQVDYTLPPLFGGFLGDLHLNQTENSLGWPVQRGQKEELLWLQKRNIANFTAQPYRYATFAKEQTGEGNQRWMLTVYPYPDKNYTITGFYVWDPYQLTSALTYPMGGVPLSECFRESVMAAAEVEFKGEIGVHGQLFRTAMLAAIEYDRKVNLSGYLGRNTDRSNEYHQWRKIGPRVFHVGLGATTYNEHIPYNQP